MSNAKKKTRSGGGLVALALGLGVLLFGGSALAAEDDVPKVPVPVKPWMPGPGGKGKVYTGKGKGGSGGSGELPELPEGFDFGGNGLYIDPNCDFVIEGNLFWGGHSAIEAETLAAVLAIDRGNTVMGYLDYLIDTLGYRQPEQIAWKIFEEASPMCAAINPEQWGPGLQSWYADFLDQVVEYVEESLGAIGFDPYAGEDELDDGPLLDAWEDED